MHIQELTIRNFRNIAKLRADFASGLNLIAGPNAQGKTNLLECIFLLATGRSFRTRADREMIPWDTGNYDATFLSARLGRATTSDEVILSFNDTEKFASINGEPIARLGELLGNLTTVLFTPADLLLVRGAPNLRRRFLDVALCQLSRKYLYNLQRYEQALRQRNALLREGSFNPTFRDELKVWDEQLVSHGAELSWARANHIARLAELASPIYATISNQRESLEIAYRASPSIEKASGFPAIVEGLHAAIDRSIEDDIRRGNTSSGPHRDDFEFHISGKDAQAFASQGQQRSCVLAMKLAEVRLMEELTSEYPVLLLDDLLSELDESRRGILFGLLNPQMQTILTATEAALIGGEAKVQRTFQMLAGEMHVVA